MLTDLVMYLGEPEGADGPLGGTLEVSEDLFSAKDGARFVSSFTVWPAACQHAFLEWTSQGWL